jgi:hypothetical protein
MAGGQDVFLDQHVIVAEAGRGLALAAGKRVGKVRRIIDPPHPLAAAAGHGLDQHRIADFGGAFGQEGRVLVLAHITWRHRHAGVLHQFFAASFRPIASIDSGLGPTQTSPASITARAKSAFSERKP